MRTDLPMLRVKFPKPQPRTEERTTPVPFRYPSVPRPASNVEDLFKRCGDPGWASHNGSVLSMETVSVWASGAELATKRQFLEAVGKRSPGADAYAAKLRKMNLKVCWSREPAMSSADVAQVRGRLQTLHQKPDRKSNSSMAGYRLKQPCKHCPFAPTETRIAFRNRERAEEIAESARVHGFPCHESAVLDEEDSGYKFGPDTQHCAGALMMMIADGYTSWPGIGNDDALAGRLLDHLDWEAPYYSSTAAFLKDNE